MSANPMKRCPECLNEVVEVAAACKYCGHVFDVTQEVEKPVAVAPPEKTKRPVALILVIVAIVLIVLYSMIGGGGDEGATPRGASLICHQFVKDSLKSPSSAKFPAIDEDSVIKDAENLYTVISYVEAQNSFGAMIRTDYICQVSYSGNGNWRLADLQMP